MARRSLANGSISSSGSSAMGDLERRLAHVMKNPKANSRKIAGIKEQLGETHWKKGNIGTTGRI